MEPIDRDASAPDLDAGLDASDALTGDAGSDASTPDAGDADASDADDPDLGTPPPGRPVFVAQGALGRTVISCDEGLNWIEDRSLIEEGDALYCGQAQTRVRCYKEGESCRFLNRDDECVTSGGRAPGTDGPDDRGSGCECSRSGGMPRGIAWGDGWFVATFGHHNFGEIWRSRDGVSWERTSHDNVGAGIAFGGGAFITASRDPLVSTDAGASWTKAAKAELSTQDGEALYNVNGIEYVETSGLFILAGHQGGKEEARAGLLTSADGGASWSTPVLRGDAARPDRSAAACAYRMQGVAEGGGRIVIAGHHGDVCVSTDAGASFDLHTIGEDLRGGLFFDGDQFVTWTRNGERARSRDGVSWSISSIIPNLIILGGTAYNPYSNVFVSVNGGYKHWYEKQAFYRSSSGAIWEVLEPERFPGSHDLNYIALGWVPRDQSACPAQSD